MAASVSRCTLLVNVHELKVVSVKVITKSMVVLLSSFLSLLHLCYVFLNTAIVQLFDSRGIDCCKAWSLQYVLHYALQ